MGRTPSAAINSISLLFRMGREIESWLALRRMRRESEMNWFDFHFGLSSFVG